MRYLSIRREIEGALPTVVELLREKNEVEALRVVMQADIEFLKTGYDNWNGGIELWTVYLRVPVKIFVSIENVHEHIASLNRKLVPLHQRCDGGEVGTGGGGAGAEAVELPHNPSLLREWGEWDRSAENIFIPNGWIHRTVLRLGDFINKI